MDQIAFFGPGILLSYVAFLVSIARPGLNTLAVMGTSMSVDRRSGLALPIDTP